MRYLLDTHTMLWWVNEYEKLSPQVKAILLNNENELFFSIASLWETAIKISIGKLSGLDGGIRVLLSKIDIMPVSMLPVTTNHIRIVEALPFIHRDPFDRIIIATAKTEEMTILSVDENIFKYDVLTVW